MSGGPRITANPLRMQLSDPRVAAAQFTIYNSLANLPVSFGSATVFVWLGATGDLTTTMIGATACSPSERSCSP